MKPRFGLSIPNREVYEVCHGTFKDWLTSDLVSHGATGEQLIRALLSGDTARLEEYRQGLVTDLLSYHEVPRPDLEAVYVVVCDGKRVRVRRSSVATPGQASLP